MNERINEPIESMKQRTNESKNQRTSQSINQLIDESMSQWISSNIPTEPSGQTWHPKRRKVWKASFWAWAVGVNKQTASEASLRVVESMTPKDSWESPCVSDSHFEAALQWT